MNLHNYLTTVSRFWNNYDGGGVAKLISINGNHVNNTNLQVEYPENAIERVLGAPIDEVVCYHIKVLFYLSCERKQRMNSVEIFVSST